MRSRSGFHSSENMRRREQGEKAPISRSVNDHNNNRWDMEGYGSITYDAFLCFSFAAEGHVDTLQQ